MFYIYVLYTHTNTFFHVSTKYLASAGDTGLIPDPGRFHTPWSG